MAKEESFKGTRDKRGMSVEHNCYPHSPYLNLNSNKATDVVRFQECHIIRRPFGDKTHLSLEERSQASTTKD